MLNTQILESLISELERTEPVVNLNRLVFEGMHKGVALAIVSNMSGVSEDVLLEEYRKEFGNSLEPLKGAA